MAEAVGVSPEGVVAAIWSLMALVASAAMGTSTLFETAHEPPFGDGNSFKPQLR
jgi:hypothetical protein